MAHTNYSKKHLKKILIEKIEQLEDDSAESESVLDKLLFTTISLDTENKKLKKENEELKSQLKKTH